MIQGLSYNHLRPRWESSLRLSRQPQAKVPWMGNQPTSLQELHRLKTDVLTKTDFLDSSVRILTEAYKKSEPRAVLSPNKTKPFVNQMVIYRLILLKVS